MKEQLNQTKDRMVEKAKEFDGFAPSTKSKIRKFLIAFLIVGVVAAEAEVGLEIYEETEETRVEELQTAKAFEEAKDGGAKLIAPKEAVDAAEKAVDKDLKMPRTRLSETKDGYRYHVEGRNFIHEYDVLIDGESGDVLNFGVEGFDD